MFFCDCILPMVNERFFCEPFFLNTTCLILPVRSWTASPAKCYEIVFFGSGELFTKNLNALGFHPCHGGSPQMRYSLKGTTSLQQ